MSNPSSEELADYFSQVLEQFAFALCEIVDKDELETDESQFVQATLSFVGPEQGEISIIMPHELCKEIAINILGLEPDEVLDDYSEDALKELLNVFLGNVLPLIYGEDMDFDFGTPDISKIDVDEWEKILNDPSSIGLLVEDGPALLRFQEN